MPSPPRLPVKLELPPMREKQPSVEELVDKLQREQHELRHEHIPQGRSYTDEKHHELVATLKAIEAATAKRFSGLEQQIANYDSNVDLARLESDKRRRERAVLYFLAVLLGTLIYNFRVLLWGAIERLLNA